MAVVDHELGTLVNGVPVDVIDETLSIQTIFDFVNELDLSLIHI